MLSKILFLVVLIALNAYFAASEIALISLNDKKIKLLAEEGNKKAKLLEQLLGEPSRFLATIQIGITLAGFLASAFAAESFADPIVENLIELGVTIPETIIRLIVVLLITIILSYFTLVLGELVPKRIAMNKAEKISFAVVRSLIILSKITSPFVKLLTSSTDFFVRLLGIDPNSSVDEVTEEEIRMMVDVGEENGAIHEHEKIMINNIFEFNNKTAEEIMTHRTEMVAFPINMEIEQVLSLLKTEQYSRIPVYEESLDNIVGILYVKDLLQLIGICNLSEFQLEKFIKKPIFVPTHKKIDELFLNLKTVKNHMAVVIDEYGGTAGIVTMEDLVEEIVGNISDEYDEEEEIEIKKIEEDVYEINALISLNDMKQFFHLDFPQTEYETLNGFLIHLFGYIPPKDQVSEISYENLYFKTLTVTDKKIDKVLVQVLHNKED